MNKLIIFLVAGVVGFLGVINGGKLYAEDVSAEVGQRVTDDTTKLDGYWYDFENVAEDQTEELITDADNLATSLNESAEFYRQKTGDVDSESDKAIFERLEESSSKLSGIMTKVADTIRKGDQTGLDQVLQEYDTEIVAYNQIVDDFNASVGASFDYEPMLTVLTAVSVLVSAGLLTAYMTKNKKTTAAHRKHMMSLFKTSLVPLVASVVTLVWFYMTPVGGTFYVLWGPVFFGYVVFCKKVYEYYAYERPKLKAKA